MDQKKEVHLMLERNRPVTNMVLNYVIQASYQPLPSSDNVASRVSYTVQSSESPRDILDGIERTIRQETGQDPLRRDMLFGTRADSNHQFKNNARLIGYKEHDKIMEAYNSYVMELRNAI